MLEEPTPTTTPPALPTQPTLQPALQDAERLLRESLSEVCHTDPMRADTGEMIRLDEMLAIAGDAAKRAVSLRRRMRQEGRATPRATKGARRRSVTAEGLAAPAADQSPASEVAAGTPLVVPHADAPPAADAASATDTRLGVEVSVVPQTAAEHRTFRDGRGVTWSVWAVHPQEGTRSAGLRGTFVQGWLAFVCEAEKRRLSPVPDGWLQCPDPELERMCLEAEVAKPEAATRRMPPIKSED